MSSSPFPSIFGESGVSMLGGMNDSFFSGFNLPDFSSFFNFNPTNFRNNFHSNFRSSNSDPMFDLAQYLSELEAMNNPQQNPVKNSFSSSKP